MGIRVRIQLLDVDGEANTPNVHVYEKTLHGERAVRMLTPGYVLDGKAMNPEHQIVDCVVDDHHDVIVRAGTPAYGKEPR